MERQSEVKKAIDEAREGMIKLVAMLRKKNITSYIDMVDIHSQLTFQEGYARCAEQKTQIEEDD